MEKYKIKQQQQNLTTIITTHKVRNDKKTSRIQQNNEIVK